MVEEGGALAQAIQSAVQAKLIENTWAAEENDTTLSEYVTMMLVNGKDMQAVQSEMGGELLGIGEDDPSVVEFTRWLFEQLQTLGGSQQQEPEQQAPLEATIVGQQQQGSAPMSTHLVQDSEMGDVAAAPADGV